MVLHELATNAAKHGALKSKGGKLKVAWRQEEDPQKGVMLHFAWDENVPDSGTAPAAIIGKAGYGTALIESTVAGLRGHIERNAHNPGISVRIWVPIAEKGNRPRLHKPFN
jgi:two-component sensor histidine kinase